MLIPTKHQDLSTNLLVIGADILFHLKNDELDIEKLYKKMQTEKNIRIEQYLDAITFLWLIDSIEYTDNLLKKKKNDITENLF
ncbi:ABC-three component system middle component 6 [Elizabethkingia meningoseptica]|uniref:ABC-three component system middle component 6 n=1 Tax=Elizabethkingia meningoseptica TaxID=238 RepID=UPI0021A860B0|nr:hypothetical protein [Elizabethkingia anophelis]